MDIILRSAGAYVFLLIVLRITTHRVSRTMTPLDMGIMFLFGGLSSQAGASFRWRHNSAGRTPASSK